MSRLHDHTTNHTTDHTKPTRTFRHLISRYDMCLCGYIEPSPDAIKAAGYHPKFIRKWFGNWVRQMAHVTKPGGWIAVGAIQYDLVPWSPEKIGIEWWKEAAASDAWEWGVDPESVVVRELDSAVLNEEWGPRYCVAMRRSGGDSGDGDGDGDELDLEGMPREELIDLMSTLGGPPINAGASADEARLAIWNFLGDSQEEEDIDDMSLTQVSPQPTLSIEVSLVVSLGVYSGLFPPKPRLTSLPFDHTLRLYRPPVCPGAAERADGRSRRFRVRGGHVR
jgi:hypothetical protein